MLDRIYKLLDCPEINETRQHVFDQIEKEIIEDDGAAYGIPNLHQLGPKLRDRTWKAKEVLGSMVLQMQTDGVLAS